MTPKKNRENCVVRRARDETHLELHPQIHYPSGQTNLPEIQKHRRGEGARQKRIKADGVLTVLHEPVRELEVKTPAREKDKTQGTANVARGPKKQIWKTGGQNVQEIYGEGGGSENRGSCGETNNQERPP